MSSGDRVLDDCWCRHVFLSDSNWSIMWNYLPPSFVPRQTSCAPTTFALQTMSSIFTADDYSPSTLLRTRMPIFFFSYISRQISKKIQNKTETCNRTFYRQLHVGMSVLATRKNSLVLLSKYIMPQFDYLFTALVQTPHLHRISSAHLHLTSYSYGLMWLSVLFCVVAVGVHPLLHGHRGSCFIHRLPAHLPGHLLLLQVMDSTWCFCLSKSI